MFYYLHYFSNDLRVLNVCKYITFRALMAGLTALVVSLLIGPWVIRKLTELKLGQPIRTAEEVHRLHELHRQKKGIPTMGGVLIVLTVVLGSLLWARPDVIYTWLLLGTMVALGAIGFADDYLKVVRKQSKGLSARAKMRGQIAVAMVVGLLLYFHPATSDLAPKLMVPFYKNPITQDIGLLFFFLVFLVVVGSSNAVNLTDGLDGLAIGCTVTVALIYAVFAYLIANFKFADYLKLTYVPNAGEITVVCAALLGASMGFLWFNCHPAQVFMGDTGSLAIGGVIGVAALCLKQELLLVVVGGVFVMEALSVIFQVLSFKLTGKRLFAMAPIHHHFELKGWSETKVVVRFWILSILFALIGLSSLKLR
ncbi:MAG: phospho-N-acetylmuramoyl-pentapeptide-transferase [Verrucomicrobiae bacterium]|nr:phospho-N-acetylmuramoyl-pentapeptide-transferase [Verrucomicrobiae bacterium]